MAGIGRVSKNGVYRNAVEKFSEKDTRFMEDFGKVMIESYEKRADGSYTESDRERLKEIFGKTARSMDNPAYFKDFYGSFCRNYGLW